MLYRGDYRVDEWREEQSTWYFATRVNSPLKKSVDRRNIVTYMYVAWAVASSFTNAIFASMFWPENEQYNVSKVHFLYRPIGHRNKLQTNIFFCFDHSTWSIIIYLATYFGLLQCLWLASTPPPHSRVHRPQDDHFPHWPSTAWGRQPCSTHFPW